MANKAMQVRHWERITKITGHAFDVDADNFLLRNLMEAPLLKNKEDIEVRFSTATAMLNGGGSFSGPADVGRVLA